MTSTTSTSPTAAHRSAISFENEIIVASSAFDAYLIISAVACRRPDPRHVRETPRRVARGRHAVRSSSAAEHDPVGRHEVLRPPALGQELRVHADAEAVAGRCPEASSSDGRTTSSRGAGDDRALDDDDVVAVLARAAPRRPRGTPPARRRGRCPSPSNGVPTAISVTSARARPLRGRSSRASRLPTLRSSSSSSPSSWIGRAPGGDRARPFRVQVDADDVVTLARPGRRR